MSTVPESETKAGPRLSLVWIVPIVCLIFAAYLIHRDLREHGPRISITFADASGLVERQTKLMHKGIPVGVVTEIELLADDQGVRLTLDLDSGARHLARAESRFWIVRPEISLNRVSGLETILSGPVINVAPGGGEEQHAFAGLAEPPDLGASAYVDYVLRATDRGSLSAGRPVVYRGMQVGVTGAARLAPGADAVLIDIRIDRAYAGLVRPGTQFWNATGLDVSFSLFKGASIRSGNLENVMSGAVSFATPDASAPPPPAGTEFPLHSSPDADWLEWAPILPLDGSVSDAPAPNQSAPRPHRVGGKS